MTRFISILVVFSLLGFASIASAQDSLLDGSLKVLAQSKKKKKKKKKKAEKVEEKVPDDEAAADAEGTEDDDDTTQAATLQRGNRMEFDGRLIRGETAGSGAVFLFQRVPRPLPSMVKKRESYLANTVQTVLGSERVEQFEKTKVEAKKEIEKKGESKKLKGKK